MNVTETSSYKTFEGATKYFEHFSEVTKTKMTFATFQPSEKVENAIIWLSGLTCTEENAITKAGLQTSLKNTKTMVICPDTSPRGLNLPNEHDTYDFGSGAGFYVNATTEHYRDHYKMYDYIKHEVVALLKAHFNVKNVSIMGHSMGGHGALILGLREQELFKSVSAFAPIVNPLKSAWGQKAFQGYLGEKMEGAELYDATELIKSGVKRSDSLLVDQGTSDEFLEEHLRSNNLVEACKESGQNIEMKYRDGFDHSYFYILSHIDEHVDFHLKTLQPEFKRA